MNKILIPILLIATFAIQANAQSPPSPLYTYLTVIRQGQHPPLPKRYGKLPSNITQPSPPYHPTTPTPSLRYEPKPTLIQQVGTHSQDKAIVSKSPANWWGDCPI